MEQAFENEIDAKIEQTEKLAHEFKKQPHKNEPVEFGLTILLARSHMHTSSAPPPDFWPIFPLFFVGVWLLVSFIISHMGWRSFSSRYSSEIRPVGTAYNSPSSWFGILGHYHNVVRVIFTDAGVYFYVMFLFRAFHPPFLVPWESVKRVEKKDGFFGTYFWLEIANDAGRVGLRLPGRIEHDLLRHRKAG